MSEKKFRLGIDVDGVLADFNTSYRKLLEGMTGKKFADGGLPDDLEPDCWAYPTKYGFTKREENESWDRIKSDPAFWVKLPTYMETAPALAVLTELYYDGHEVYFITNRPGVMPHFQTSMFLGAHNPMREDGLVLMPNVIVAEKKGPILAAMNITHFIDDKPENCYDSATFSPNTQTFMLRRRWNDHPDIVMKAESMGITIVPSIREFFESLAREEKVNAIVV